MKFKFLGPNFRSKNGGVELCIYQTSPIRAVCGTRSISKRSKVTLNSEISFSKTGCLTKAKESSLPFYLFIASVRIWVHAFPMKSSSVKYLNSRHWYHFYDDNRCANHDQYMCVIILPYYLPIGRIIGFIPFPRVLVLSVSSRIWTRVAVSISYDDNHYITGIFGSVDLELSNS